ALEIVRYVQELWKKRPEPICFLEPALGTGAFFSALQQVFPNTEISKARGIELDPRMIHAAQEVWKPSDLEIVHGDFTLQEPEMAGGRANLIVTNPPYVRHHHVLPEEKKRLQALVRDRLELSISGLAGLYCYFLLLADQWLAEGGLSAW